MILHPHPPGFVAIPQSAHALLAFQLADHWGNRTTPRPAPRADVLAAVLLHDAGWDGREVPARLAADGLPLAFDTLPEGEREALWASAVERAATRGRYVEYLVSHHVGTLAVGRSTTPHAGFAAVEEARRARLLAQLGADPAFAQLLRTGADDVNRAVVRLADAIAVHLVRGSRGRIVLEGLPQDDGPVDLVMTEVAERTYRLRPWPLAGRRLALKAEGRLLPSERFGDEAALRAAWDAGPALRLGWTLLSTGEPAD
jgi:hypothetical protein